MTLVSSDVTSSGAAHHEQNRAGEANSREQDGQRVMGSDRF
jgi:hypothetical protein